MEKRKAGMEEQNGLAVANRGRASRGREKKRDESTASSPRITARQNRRNDIRAFCFVRYKTALRASNDIDRLRSSSIVPRCAVHLSSSYYCQATYTYAYPCVTGLLVAPSPLLVIFCHIFIIIIVPSRSAAPFLLTFPTSD